MSSSPAAYRGAERRLRRRPAAPELAGLVRLPAGGNLTFFTGTQGRKARKTRLIQEAGVLSLLVQHEVFPYRYVTVEGTVVGIDRPPSADQMLAVVLRYLPEEQAQGFVAADLGNPGPGLVLFTIRPGRWLTFDFAEEAG